MQRQWFVNGRFLRGSITGVQRYASEIVCALDLLLAEGHPMARDLRVRLVVPRGTSERLSLAKIETIVAGSGSGHLWEQTALPKYAKTGLLSLANTGPVAARRHIVCIHDLNTRAYPLSYSRAFRTLYRVLIPALGATATTVATVSAHSANELLKHKICPPNRIQVMPNGYEHTLRWRPAHSVKSQSAAGLATIAVLGSTALHKNVGLIVGMAERLSSVGLRVAVVGASDPLIFGARPAVVGAANLHWLGRLSDDEIAALLRGCLCLAFPSFAEGFGLPALEAMAVGCPVVASDRTSLPEICRDAALYASPSDPDEWFGHFVRLKENAVLRDTLIRKGQARARHYSWRRSAELYLEEMCRIDGLPR